MNTPDWILSKYPADYKGYAVELGAVDGIYLSNTLALEDKVWKVLCIEPNPRHHAALTKNRKLVMRCACDKKPRIRAKLYEASGIAGDTYAALRFDNPRWGKPAGGIQQTYETTVLTLDQCLVCVGFPRLDVLVLDVDGLEEAILSGLNLEKWKPGILIVEEIFLNGGPSRDIPGYHEEFRDGPNIHDLRDHSR